MLQIPCRSTDELCPKVRDGLEGVLDMRSSRHYIVSSSIEAHLIARKRTTSSDDAHPEPIPSAYLTSVNITASSSAAAVCIHPELERRQSSTPSEAKRITHHPSPPSSISRLLAAPPSGTPTPADQSPPPPPPLTPPTRPHQLCSASSSPAAHLQVLHRRTWTQLFIASHWYCRSSTLHSTSLGPYSGSLAL